MTEKVTNLADRRAAASAEAQEKLQRLAEVQLMQQMTDIIGACIHRLADECNMRLTGVSVRYYFEDGELRFTPAFVGFWVDPTLATGHLHYRQRDDGGFEPLQAVEEEPSAS